MRAESGGKGQGSRLIVVLPAQTLAANERESKREDRGRGRSTADAFLQGMRVLAVDDEPNARPLVAEVLEQGGAEVPTADPPMRRFRRRTLKVAIISDIGMPGHDGYDLIATYAAARAIRAATFPRSR